MKKFIWILGLISVLIFLVVLAYYFYGKNNKELTKREKQIERIESDKQDLSLQLIEIEKEKDSIKVQLEITLDSIEKLNVVQAKKFIVKRYQPQIKVVSEIEKITGKVIKRPTIVLDSVVAIEVVKDLVSYDSTIELLENCQESNENLSEQLNLILKQNDLISSQAERYRKQRNLYSIPILGNILGLPNFIKIVVN